MNHYEEAVRKQAAKVQESKAKSIKTNGTTVRLI